MLRKKQTARSFVSKGRRFAEGSKQLEIRSCFTSRAALLCNPFVQAGLCSSGSCITEPSSSDAAWAAKPPGKAWLNTWGLSSRWAQAAERPPLGKAGRLAAPLLHRAAPRINTAGLQEEGRSVRSREKRGCLQGVKIRKKTGAGQGPRQASS